jgi:predicted esterase
MTINISKPAKIITHGNKQANYYWLACHGYGELVRFFINKFTELGDEHFVVAPEGLNRFYLNGFSGRVGANWMTKEDREQDINTNNQYLAQVYNTYPFQEKTLFAFGFSQGTETLSRWLVNQKIAPKAIILWGNGLPEDLSNECNLLWKDTKIYFVIGSNDNFITPERLALKKGLFDKHQLDYELVSYEGEHKIIPSLLTQLAKNIIS